MVLGALCLQEKISGKTHRQPYGSIDSAYCKAGIERFTPSDEKAGSVAKTELSVSLGIFLCTQGFLLEFRKL